MQTTCKSLLRTLTWGLALVLVVGPGATALASTEASDEPTEEEAVAAEAAFQRHRLFYSNLLVLRYNALGLQNLFDIGYRYQLYDDDRPLFKNSYIGASSVTLLTPAYAQLGGSIKAQPLAILSFEARFSWLQYFTTFNLVQSFDSAHADYSDSTIKSRGGDGANYAGTGWQMNLITTLQGRIGPIILRDTLQMVYHDMNLQDRDGFAAPQRVWYDQYFDMLLPRKGWVANNDFEVFYQINENLLAGLRYSLTHAFYTDDSFAPGESTDNPNGPTHRVGPAAAYIFFDEPGAKFNRPTLVLIVNWWLKHRWRTGEDVSQAVPYVVLGFAFSGDLL